MNTAVFGIFPGAGQAESAMASLALARFAYGDVSVIMLNGDGSTATAHAGRTRPSGAKTAVDTAPAIGGNAGSSLRYWDVACRRDETSGHRRSDERLARSAGRHRGVRRAR